MQLVWALRDCANSARRSLRHTFRNVDSLITSIMLPVMMLLLFVFIFGGAVQTGTEYVNYIIPGVILVCIAYASSTTAAIVAKDTVGGLFDRFRTMPMWLPSILTGYVSGSLVRNAISATLVFMVAFAIGFRPNADIVDWLAVAGILTLSSLVFCWLATVLGLISKSIDSAYAFAFFIIFLPYISSAFVPTVIPCTKRSTSSAFASAASSASRTAATTPSD
jgi:ABC-2 type transport system permease protein